MDAPEGTWELAEIEELLGDSLFFTGEPDAAIHYQAAQKALMPPGVRFTSLEESEPRMEAFQRIVAKLYGIGGDGRARASHDGKPHPRYAPRIPDSDLGKLLLSSDWWVDYRLAGQWFEAAKTLAAKHPVESRAACEWSLEHFARYAQEWTAHLPASRWDSDGGAEMQEVSEFKNALSPHPASSAPDWVRLLLAGNRREAESRHDAATDEFPLLAEILAKARKLDGESKN